jgi:hypothetical protein
LTAKRKALKADTERGGKPNSSLPWYNNGSRAILPPKRRSIKKIRQRKDTYCCI